MQIQKFLFFTKKETFIEKRRKRTKRDESKKCEFYCVVYVVDEKSDQNDDDHLYF